MRGFTCPCIGSTQRATERILTVAATVALVLLSTTARGNVLHVPSEYATVAAALNSVSTLDTVLVAPGVYPGAEFVGNASSPQGVTLMGSGWPCGTTLIDCEGCTVSNVLHLEGVQGWRVTNFEMTWSGYGVRLTSTMGCEIDHNFIHGATGLPGWGNPVTACGDILEMDIHHNLMVHCNAGVFIGWEGDPGITRNVRIFNNTICNTWGQAAQYGLDAIQFRAVTPTGSQVVNNIIYKSLGYGVEFAMCDQNETEVSYNCVIETAGPWLNMQPGAGNILVDPAFAHSHSLPDYFYLSPQSPCIDTGDPDFPSDPDGSRSDIGAFSFTQLNAPHRTNPAAQYSLSQNYPNPFNATTEIAFSLAHEGPVNLTVYSVNGREVTQLVSGGLNAGAHSVQFEGSNLSTGVYFYRLTGYGHPITRRMVLLK